MSGQEAAAPTAAEREAAATVIQRCFRNKQSAWSWLNIAELKALFLVRAAAAALPFRNIGARMPLSHSLCARAG